MNKKWECYPKNETLAKQIAQEHQISELLAEILINRGVEASQIEKFLHPTRNDFHDPFLMPDMEKAVDRILRAMDQKEKIVIYGDYYRFEKVFRRPWHNSGLVHPQSFRRRLWLEQGRH